MAGAMKIVAPAVAALVIGGVVLVATGPHDWVGRTVCNLRGGEWTGGFDPRAEIVSAGRTCVRD